MDIDGLLPSTWDKIKKIVRTTIQLISALFPPTGIAAGAGGEGRGDDHLRHPHPQDPLQPLLRPRAHHLAGDLQ